MSKRLRMSAAAAALVLGVSACAGDDAATTSGGGDGGMSVEILQPADGDMISVPFTLEVDSSEELGTTDTGLHHVHIFFDGDDSSYEVIEDDNREPREITADSPAVEGLEPGEHVLNISLRTADHSPAGAEAEVTVNVEAPGGSPAGDSDDSGPPSYGY
ncbi:MAG TPA: hypothetical protein VJ644_08790 [Jiangellaceae bacterium]|nr:hypothetical protein [Jiangellaceae bacterium]